MFLTRKEALKLHGQMWSDMQAELGDDPSPNERTKYKMKWCKLHFPNESILSNCFLCEYTFQYGCSKGCEEDCPIVWPYGRCGVKGYYYFAPISAILALPERTVNENI